jgi:hypothetical protein
VSRKTGIVGVEHHVSPPRVISGEVKEAGTHVVLGTGKALS